MDYLRVLLVPFHLTILLMFAVFTALFAICERAGWLGAFPALFIGIWLLKYCYVLIEHLADGATEPPVMSTDMLSPLEVRPWIHAALCAGGTWLCLWLGGIPGTVLAALLLLLLPASIAVLGQGAPFYEAVNPLALLRVVRDLGAYYPMILGLIGVYAIASKLLARLDVWHMVWFALGQFMLVSVFGLIGASLYARRQQLGLQPSRSPERAATREDHERIRLRARMIDEVFQLVRVGRHVDATQPLAVWFSADNGVHTAEDASVVAERALQWNQPVGLEAVGSTLVRHVLRSGRTDVALAIYDALCRQVPALSLDTRADLMAIAAYAESIGRARHAQALRDSAARMRFWS